MQNAKGPKACHVIARAEGPGKTRTKITSRERAIPFHASSPNRQGLGWSQRGTKATNRKDGVESAVTHSVKVSAAANLCFHCVFCGQLPFPATEFVGHAGVEHHLWKNRTVLGPGHRCHRARRICLRGRKQVQQKPGHVHAEVSGGQLKVIGNDK